MAGLSDIHFIDGLQRQKLETAIRQMIAESQTAPLPHAASHTDGVDQVADATTVAAGLLPALDKLKLNSIAVAAPNKTLYVDGNRVDVYTENGALLTPFKTIQAAIDQIALNNDDITNPYNVVIANGKYYETVSLESLNLHRITLTGEGLVQVRPTTNQALKSLTSNNNLLQLHVKRISFLAPVVITGVAGGPAFSDHIWEDCAFVAGDGTQHGTVTLTCVNNFSLRRAYDEEPITLANVNYALIDSGNIQGVFSVSMNNANPLPSWGQNGGVIVRNSALTAAPVFAMVVNPPGYQLVFESSRAAADASAVTVNTNVKVTAYNSALRGTWANSGTITLRNSSIGGYTGTAPVLTYQPAAQIANTPAGSVASTNVQDAINELGARSGSTMDLTNKQGGGVSHPLGTVVYTSGSAQCKKASAAAIGTARAVALAKALVADDALGKYQTGGPLEITGATLTPGATYFLDPVTPGAMTVTPPTTTGQVLVQLGQAITSTLFLVEIEEVIIL